MSKHNWLWHLERVDHYRALEQDEVYLDDCAPELYPWHLVTEAYIGATTGSLPTSIYFSGKSITGLKFSWSVDVMDRKNYQIVPSQLELIAELVPVDKLDLLLPIAEQINNAAKNNAKGLSELREKTALAIKASMLFRGAVLTRLANASWTALKHEV